MSNLPRKLQKIFGGGIGSASGNVAVIGSTADGVPAYSFDLDAIQSNLRYLQGFAAQTVGNSSPVLQEFNAILLMLTQQVAYLMQKGVAEWLATETYYIGNFASVVGVIFVSKTDNNIGNPVTDTNNWQTLAASISGAVVNPAQLASVWGLFNGSSGSTSSSFGLTSFTKLGVGNYLLTFPALPNANYSFNLSCMQENSVAATIMATRFPPDIRTTTQFQVRTVSNFDSSGFDAPELSVQLFCTP